LQKIAEFFKGASYKNLTEVEKGLLAIEDDKRKSEKKERRQERLIEEQETFYNAVKNWEDDRRSRKHRGRLYERLRY
jgi:hypothetical protein